MNAEDHGDGTKARRRSRTMAIALALAHTPHAAAHIALNATLAQHGLALWITPLIAIETIAYLTGCRWTPWRVGTRNIKGTLRVWLGGITAGRSLLAALPLLGPIGWVAGAILNGWTRPSVVGAGLATQGRYESHGRDQVAGHYTIGFTAVALTAGIGGSLATMDRNGLAILAGIAAVAGLASATMLGGHPWTAKLEPEERNRNAGRLRRAIRPAIHHALSDHGRALTTLAFSAAGGVSHVAQAGEGATGAAGIATAAAWIGAAIGAGIGRLQRARKFQRMIPTQRALAPVTLVLTAGLATIVPPGHGWCLTTVAGTVGGLWVTKAVTDSLRPGEGGTNPLSRALGTLRGQGWALLAWAPAYGIAIALWGWAGFAITAATLAWLPTPKTTHTP